MIIQLMNADDFMSSHTSELLAHLEDIQGINFGKTLNFSTQTQFRGSQPNKVMDAFNIYLRSIARHTHRIIITL